MMTIVEKYNARVDAVDSLLCVGLDADISRLDDVYLQEANPQFAFNKAIIEQTHEYVAAYKPNVAFYEAQGTQGQEALQLTMQYLRDVHPSIVTICDAKRADIGNTSEAYARAIFDDLAFDAVTLHPYLGKDALAPFLRRDDKVCIILCRTSNEGAAEFQDLEVNGGIPLWQKVATRVATDWNVRGNCMLVAGATYPDEIGIIRSVVGDMTLLVPGIGVQGGNVQQTVTQGMNSQRKGLIINSSRGIIFSENPARAAQELRDGINEYR
ncbi:MAG: orotidine-5'-phosphate decarboxylase [Chloroflexota bacterium]